MGAGKYTLRNRSAFTVVELIVVIIVIAILATIIVVVYRGVTQRAVEASLLSDLDTASSQLASYAKSGAYPTTPPTLPVSGENNITYTQRPYGYCLTATNPKTDKVFTLKSSTMKSGEGNCDTAGSAVSSTTGGSANGDCSVAQFNFQPTTNGQGGDIAWDSDGNMFVADPGNQVIRKITPDCVVSTYAGQMGVIGSTNGPLATARFNYPVDLVFDREGNMYVADRGSSSIRKITPEGEVSTLTTSAILGRSGQMAIYNNVLYITRDGFGGSTVVTLPNSVYRVYLDGRAQPVEQFVGSGVAGFNDAVGSTAQFNGPSGIAIDANGTIYVTDTGNERIRKITQDGTVSTYAGTGTRGSTDGPALSATFAGPRAIAVDPAGWVYVRGLYYYAGTYNDSRLRVITPDGIVKPVYWTNSMTTGAMLPYALAIDKNFNIWIAQANGSTSASIYKVTQ